MAMSAIDSTVATVDNRKIHRKLISKPMKTLKMSITERNRTDDTDSCRHVQFREFLFNSIPIQFEGMNCNSIQNQFNARRLEVSKIVTWKITILWIYLLLRFRP